MIEHAAVSLCLDGLEEEGYVECSQNCSRRRVANIKLIPKGEKLANSRISLMDGACKEIFANLSATEYKQLDSLIQEVDNDAGNAGISI